VQEGNLAVSASGSNDDCMHQRKIGVLFSSGSVCATPQADELDALCQYMHKECGEYNLIRVGDEML